MSRRRRAQAVAVVAPSSPVAAPPATRARWLVPLLLVLAVLLAYAPVFDAGFVNYDDQAYVTENRHVTAGLTRQDIAWAFTAFEAGNWHPLTWLSHMADCQAFGLRSGAHHATNVLLHALAAVLVFWVLHRLTGRTGPSALVAALFALHPLNVESVAWVSERKNVLSTVFALLTLGAYARYCERPGRARYAVVALCLALGLLAKPMLVTLPCVLLLVDVWPLRRLRLGSEGAWRQLRVLVVEKLPLLALSAASSILTVAAQRASGAVTSLEAIPLDARVANALVSYITYLRRFVWPTRLGVFYPHTGGSLASPRVWAAAAILAGVSALAWRERSRRPYLLFGWLFYLGTLVPVIGLVQVGSQALADRYAYLPLLGIFVAVVWWGAEARGASRQLTAAAVLWLVALGLLTFREARTWHDSRTLFEHALSVTHGNYVALTNLGLVDASELRWDSAIRRFESALAIRPGHAEARANLGVALAKMGRTDEAIPELQKALLVDPDSALTHANLGLALRVRDPGAALLHMRRAVELKPDFVDARLNLGAALLEAGQRREAQAMFEAALALDPASATTRFRLGSILLERGHPEEAMAPLAAALRLDASLSEARNSLGVAALRTGRVDEAIARFREMLRESPRQAEAEANLGAALARKGLAAEAEPHLRESLRLLPDQKSAHTTLGALLARQGKLQEAVPHFAAAVAAEPGDADAQNNLGAALLQLGRRDEAMLHLHKAIESNPSHADAHANLGVALLLAGERAAAVAELQEALRLDPGHLNAGAQLAAARAARMPN
jgi:tetratricopeptide (TPR) repeat protein